MKNYPYTTNFNVETDRKIICTCGHPQCDQRPVKQFVLDKVQKMRDDLNAPYELNGVLIKPPVTPIIITSGGRCPFHRCEVGRKDSDHQLGYALDLFYETIYMRNKLMILAGRYGCTRSAIGPNFVHAAWTPTDRRDVPTWTYS